MSVSTLERVLDFNGYKFASESDLCRFFEWSSSSGIVQVFGCGGRASGLLHERSDYDLFVLIKNDSVRLPILILPSKCDVDLVIRSVSWFEGIVNDHERFCDPFGDLGFDPNTKLAGAVSLKSDKFVIELEEITYDRRCIIVRHRKFLEALDLCRRRLSNCLSRSWTLMYWTRVYLNMFLRFEMFRLGYGTGSAKRFYTEAFDCLGARFGRNEFRKFCKEAMLVELPLLLSVIRQFPLSNNSKSYYQRVIKNETNVYGETALSYFITYYISLELGPHSETAVDVDGKKLSLKMEGFEEKLDLFSRTAGLE